MNDLTLNRRRKKHTKNIHTLGTKKEFDYKTYKKNELKQMRKRTYS